ncbi:TPA: hypothetical protein DD690_02255 [Candidatus Daviesbacteria bacterium]|nr:MAG: hypothetical protein A3E67_04690 [Candidatus Daviesbacteria bacterium RIFCSPHIGHO2_12_FULL_38_25]OGE68237.1 MAG: hypothetical protein A3H81_04225 [Candidatus Daviesbacteria bacterium RIFCSPLOWO2_02_FULL_38_18]OGE73246.1 MAG: hypothetical protein A3H18_04380 [Candidatus Daviesbacteria bacterium RIFCSPLOWO2_12_FULL_38_10]HBQ50780.1 hypothetical protein [Candidatus Daviesbacteria bacterium]HCB22693.1 hypothetical protein [Candidatus Daviesbacteria bacterium]
MRFFSKRTQTLIASLISVIIFFIYPNITQSQEPVPNNKFGIHIISATPDESSPAASLVNTNGDWGYITFLIESKDRNENKWQEFFNDLRRRHLIPIVRLATKPVNEHWERPYEKEYEAWADFLDKLNWPVKNRYVVIYNEPNHAKEWGNFTDPKNYAQVLDQIVTALKNKNQDFFVLNAGLDQAAPHQPPQYYDEELFLKEMEKTVPGIFNKLDGWSSHSYPNPAFVGSPNAYGRGTVRGWMWELQVLRNLGLTKNLPVFITETGWKRNKGLSSEIIGEYLQIAFLNAWSSNQIMAVTPFLLNYQEPLFEDFSFKNPTNGYYPQYEKIQGMPKISGQPVQENKAELLQGEIYSSIVSGQDYQILLKFKNTGQSIWNSKVKLVTIQGGKELGIENVTVDKAVEPGQEYSFNLKLKAPDSGIFKVALNLFNEEKQFDSPNLEFTTEVKAPVILVIKSGLKWKKDFSGNYFLTVSGPIGEKVMTVNLNKELEARFLLPDYAFDFTLERPYYHLVRLRQTLKPGVNILDFGSLQPDILTAILKPKQFLLYFDLFRPS